MNERRECGQAEAAGFTLLELLVVIAILGVLMRFVLPALLGDIPSAQVAAEARKLAARLNYLRSESRLRGRSYALQLDPEHGRYRIVLPPERRLVTLEEEQAGTELPQELVLGWYRLPEGIRIAGIGTGRASEAVAQPALIRFDPRGRTPQRIVYLEHRRVDGLVWSVVVSPLAGKVTAEKGRREFETASDLDF